MYVRLEKARAIVSTVRVRKQGDTWLVLSQSGHGKGYIVTCAAADHYRCTCPDFECRHVGGASGCCKHVLAMSIVITAAHVSEGEANGSPLFPLLVG